MIPADDSIGEYDGVGTPLVSLPPESPSMKAIDSIVEKMLRVAVVG
ncbi:MAG: hypothetical protein HY740_03600 [Chloroflexi bacterium]|nr:hypothetical protein [Chloroflexota bacterium]